jgi:hypothetical protein
LERRSSTRWRPSAGLDVRVRRVGRRTERVGFLCDVSPTGALLEFESRLPLGTLLQLSFRNSEEPTLVAVVRTSLSVDFTRRYGVACLHSEIPLSKLMLDVDDAPHLGFQWPATRSDIRRVYRSLALKMHPDAGGSDDRFRTLHREYENAIAVATR